jgi:two-component system response regulator CpxR
VQDPLASSSASGRPRLEAPSILVIDDDKELCGMIAEYLSTQGCSVDAVYDGPSGLARAYERVYDLIVLDVMLPRLDGFDLLRALRRRSDVPVILLTARAGEADRLQGFEVGADDYLPKPFAASARGMAPSSSS